MGQPGWVSGDFGRLDTLQQTVFQTAAGIDGEHGYWTSQVNALADQWSDQPGVNFQEISAAAVAVDKANNELLQLLGAASDRCGPSLRTR
ncbi:hypothetical protein [Phytohabitans rumicis]|uniref:Uncharacterized protein n=1 Tax=Phytohabitans rumicis TaxID=1076125 RepID=A0A6V8LMN8_9ACTN|nr:hypothetical protein [Phytohabitans rumicis]GFJ95367.1 hypothetical protein Prum_090090 [Phytohabitans rumicis]